MASSLDLATDRAPSRTRLVAPQLRDALRLKTRYSIMSPPSRDASERLPERMRSLDPHRYSAHLYLRWLARSERIERHPRETHTEPEGLERIVWNVARRYYRSDGTLLRYPPMGLTEPSVATHATDTALYGMWMSAHLDLPLEATSALGEALCLDELERHEELESSEATSRSADDARRALLERLESLGGDLASTFQAIMTYERGLDAETHLEMPWYRQNRALHGAVRIQSIARRYTRAMRAASETALAPYHALERVRECSGESLDPGLVSHFEASMGLYPTGTVVLLNTGVHATVIEPPSDPSEPERPVIQPLEGDNAARIDLSDERYEDLMIETVSTPDASHTREDERNEEE